MRIIKQPPANSQASIDLAMVRKIIVSCTRVEFGNPVVQGIDLAAQTVMRYIDSRPTPRAADAMKPRR